MSNTTTGGSKTDPTAILSGALFMLLGAGFLIVGSDYAFGTPRAMGPGFFPRVLAGILLVLGILIVLTERKSGDGSFSFSELNWRALTCVTLATLAFAYLTRPLGIAPAIFIAVLIVTRATPGMGLLRSVCLGAGIALFCVLAFVEGLGLPMQAFGPLFGF